MRYSQPYGTPQPPLGQYPRYINGNPVTGTEGSIPPATAFDEAQVEIVTVIANAGLTPDHADLTQLWQALMALFAQRYITTQITKSVHGAGADFPDLVAAMDWLGKYIITQTGHVTFMIAPGKWTYVFSVEINHPNASRIAIQGSALLGATPQPPNFTISGYANATDATNQIVYLRSVYATELSFTGGISGFKCFSGLCTLRYLLITGSQTIDASKGYASGIEIWAYVKLDGVSMWGFGNAGIWAMSAGIWCDSGLTVSCSYCNWGMYVQSASFYFVASGWLICTSNKLGGIAVFGSFFTAWWVYVAGNDSTPDLGAVVCSEGSQMQLAGTSKIFLNSRNGVIVLNGAVWAASDPPTYYQQNQWWGVYLHGGWSEVYQGIFSAPVNGYGSIFANWGAFCGAHGSTLAAGSQGTTSPSVNTQGNANSWIDF